LTNANRQPLPFHREMEFEYGTLREIAPGLRRLVCENPGQFTFNGTNCYVVGRGEVAVIDPGPAEGRHLEALLAGLGRERVTHILITHCHSDHSGAAEALKHATGAVLCGLPRSPDDPARGAKAPSGADFLAPVAYDQTLKNGDRIKRASFEIEAIHTPGHAPDHLCFYLSQQNLLLSGDHVMGWNTTVVAPPEGHMGSYMRSLELLLWRHETAYYPAHGGPVSQPRRLVKALIMHRRWREGEIVEWLRQGLKRVGELLPRIYPGLDPALEHAAALALLGQLEFMVEKGMAASREPGPLSLDHEFSLLAGGTA
jgi:glyoxylase-like metal-dependent hydrolase (beta-lactamase superfamily II)